MTDADIEALRLRLERLASELIERARADGSDAIELLNQSTALHRAAFVLRAAAADGIVDLRSPGG